jgi:hypothetical protein
MDDLGFRPSGIEEFRAVRDAEAEGLPHLLLRSGDGALVVRVLDPGGPVLVGRSETCAVPLPWDGRVSRGHARLVEIASAWTIADEGSRNGTYVNGERISRRVRLGDRDVIGVGDVEILFRSPGAGSAGPTVDSGDDRAVQAVLGALTARERAIMAALCAPLGPLGDGEPATGTEIAASLGTDLANIKAALTVLYRKFGLAALPAGEKRQRLAGIAHRHRVGVTGRGGGR